MLIHTPHLEDKYQGTRMILDMLCADRRVDRGRVLVDHVEEHTVRLVLEAGFWAGITLYPISKCTPARAVDIIERYGTERLVVNSAGDWGPSKPTAVPDFILEMRRRGHAESEIRRVVYENPLAFFGQSRNFSFRRPDGDEQVKVTLDRMPAPPATKRTIG
jgi:predicted metal-dependent TIM-barrel fold hydrolase